MKSIPLFKNEFGFLNNFHISPFVWDGCCWNTVEHAFQAAKAIFSNDRWLIRIAKTPAIAKRLGRGVLLREDWEQVKVSIMTELVWLKFDYNPTLRDKLINTYPAELIEGNYWHDNFWGDCYCRKCMKYEGKNMLGFILMEVRNEFQNRQKQLTNKILKVQITKEYLRKNPNHVLVFGDNLIHKGKGGAAILRDEPNTFGFITKKYPNNRLESFYVPDEYRSVYKREIRLLQYEVNQNPNVLFLISKIGSNLANKYNIFEKIIKPNIKKDMLEYPNVKFLW